MPRSCHCTKSLRDSGGCGRAVPREESLLASEAPSLKDRAVADLTEHGAPRMIGRMTIRNTEKFLDDYIIRQCRGRYGDLAAA
jgi:hypothetical protein